MGEVDQENKDVSIKFLHPPYPSTSFHWPSRNDICWVPNIHLLCGILPPSTQTGRQYQITKEDDAKIANSWKDFLSKNT